MNPQNESVLKPSFYAKHLHITGIEHSNVLSAEDVAGDISAMRALDLPGLDFWSVAKSSEHSDAHQGHALVRMINSGRSLIDRLFTHHGELLGIAAMLLLFIVPFSTYKNDAVISQGIRTKGGNKVTVYLERNGQVTQIASFDESLGLANGDRIRVEVLSGTARNAFLFITSKLQSRVLTPVEDIFSERLHFSSGERAIFSGSVELVGENEGEALNVLLCNTVVEAAQLTEMINNYSQGGMTTPKGCFLKTIRLR